MSKILPIIIAPDPILKAVANPVSKVDDPLRAFIEQMFATMYDANGIGLAAPQVNVGQRVMVVDIARDNAPPQPQAFINPEIIKSAEALRNYNEGCLSLPEFYAEVERPDWIILKYIDLQGQSQEIKADGMLATVIQHELDHLNGVLLLDKVSKLRRDTALRRFRKMKAEMAEGLL